MNKFKVGDRVRPISNPSNSCTDLMYIVDGGYLMIENESARNFYYGTYDRNGERRTGCSCWDEDDLELIKGDNKVKERRTFKLLKDTPDVKKGALYQEECEDGTQPYRLITKQDHRDEQDASSIYVTRSLVEDQPQWFVEVFKTVPEYMTQTELTQWETFKKTGKRSVGRPKKTVETSTGWTPERRKAHGKKIKAAWKKRNAARSI